MSERKMPTNDQLAELFKAAIEYKEAKPWEWIYDIDIFCIENPKDKTIGYCSVMGKYGHSYALGVYPGDEGIISFNTLVTMKEELPIYEYVHVENCLMCSFEDRDYLKNEDRKQIKDLGLSFRGKNAWPMFRRHEPGFMPWYLTDEECVFLTIALKQALCVVEGYKNGSLNIDIKRGKTVLRYFDEKKAEWCNKEFMLDIPNTTYEDIIITNDILIQRLKKETRTDMTYEIDCCFLPVSVQENKNVRPYYPRALLIAEHGLGQIIGYEMYLDKSEDVNVALKGFVDVCSKVGLPREILVLNGPVYGIFGDLCKKVGIKLKEVNKLSKIDEAMRIMAKDFTDN